MPTFVVPAPSATTLDADINVTIPSGSNRYKVDPEYDSSEGSGWAIHNPAWHIEVSKEDLKKTQYTSTGKVAKRNNQLQFERDGNVFLEDTLGTDTVYLARWQSTRFFTSNRERSYGKYVRFQAWKTIVHGTEVWSGWRSDSGNAFAEASAIASLETLAQLYWRNNNGIDESTNNPFLNPMDNSLSGFSFVRAPRIINNRLEFIPQTAPSGTSFGTDVVQWQDRDTAGALTAPQTLVDLRNKGGQVVTTALPSGATVNFRVRRYIRFGSTGFNYSKWYVRDGGSPILIIDPRDNTGGAEPIFGDRESIAVFDDVGSNLPSLSSGRAVF